MLEHEFTILESEPSSSGPTTSALSPDEKTMAGWLRPEMTLVACGRAYAHWPGSLLLLKSVSLRSPRGVLWSMIEKKAEELGSSRVKLCRKEPDPARGPMMWWLHYKMGLSKTFIGELLKRDPTTVYLAIHRMDNRIRRGVASAP